MTATPNVVAKSALLAPSYNGTQSALLTTGITDLNNTQINFSTGWTFKLFVYVPSPNPSAAAGVQVTTNLTISGGSGGNITIVDTGGVAAVLLSQSGGNFAVMGSTDSFTTFTRLLSGPVAFTS